MRLFFGWFLLSLLLVPTFILSQEHESDSPEHIRDRQAWFNKGRTAPDGTSGAPLLHKAYQQKQAKREEEAKRALTAPAITTPIFGSAWKAMGPGPFKSNATGSADAYDYGFVSGRVTTVAVDQADTTGNTVYVGTANGGIWKSTNAANATASAVTWKPLTDQQSSLAIGSIAIQPGNRNVIIAGTGEANFSGDSYYAQGFLRSTDGGNTWSMITTDKAGYVSFLGVAIGALAFSPDHPNVVVAGVGYSDKGEVDGVDSIQDTRFGLWYSIDAGQTWNAASVRDGSYGTEAWSVNSIIYNPDQHAFYAAMGFHGVYSSSDGINWQRLTNQPGSMLSVTNCPAYTTSNCPILRGALTLRPGANDMFVWYVDNNLKDQGIYRSTNGGSTWTAISTTSIDSCGDTDGCGTAQGSYNLELAAVGTSSGVDLYAGAINIYKCSLSGSNPTCAVKPFVNLTHVYGCSPIASTAHVHPDQHGIDFVHAAPNVMYFGNDGGMYRTLTASGLTNGSCTGTNPFQNLNQGFGSVTEFVYLSGHPTDPTVFLGGTQDNGSPATDSTHDGSSQTSWITVNGGDGGYNAINPKNPTEWFTSHTGVSVARCTSGINCSDSTFTTVITNKNLGNDVSEFYPPFILDPGVSGVMLAGTCRLWRGPTTTAAGWTAISKPMSSTTYCDPNTTSTAITALAAGGAVGTKGSQIVFAGYDHGIVVYNLALDTGGSWKSLPVTGFPISSIVIDPTDKSGKTAYFTVLGFNNPHVFKYLGAVDQIFDISGDLPNAPVNTIAPDPENPSLLYVGTDVGVFYTDNAGQNWTEVAPGTMPNAVVTHLQLYEYNKVKKLRAATYGRGVWEIPLYWNNPPTGFINSGTSKEGSLTVSQGQTLAITGWAADEEDGAPVASVQLFRDGYGLGSATLGIARPDVAKAFNRTDWLNSGWMFKYVPDVGVEAGEHELSAVAYDSAGLPTTIGTKTISVLANKPPVGAIDSVVNPWDGTLTVPQNGSLLIKGWAADNEDGAPVSLVQVLNLQTYYAVGTKLGLSRPDIATAFKRPDWTNSGWEATWQMSTATGTFAPGKFTIVATAVDSLGAVSTLSGTYNVTITASPVVRVLPADVNFETVGVHDGLVLQTGIANFGAAAAQVSAISVSGPFKQTSSCIGSVGAQKSCTINLTFAPGAPGKYTGTLSVTANDSTTPHTVSLEGNAVEDTLQTPASVNFGNTTVGVNSAPQTVTLKNLTTHTVSLVSVPLDGTTTRVGGTCVVPGSLAAGASCTVVLVDKPTYIGQDALEILVNTDQLDSPRHIPTTVVGTGASFSLNTYNLSFPNTAMGTSRTGYVTLKNTGNEDLHVSSITTMPYTPSFPISSNCDTVVPAATCTITVVFSPRLIGYNSSSVVINSDSKGTGSDGFEVSGVGTGVGLEITPTYMSFSSVATNTLSSGTLSVYNSSSVAINIKSLSVAAPFSATNECVNPISPRTNCSIAVGFKDASAGTFNGALTINTDDSVGSYVLPMTGIAY